MSDYTKCPSCGKRAYKPNIRAWGNCGCVRKAREEAQKKADMEEYRKEWAQLKQQTKDTMDKIARRQEMAKMSREQKNRQQKQNLKEELPIRKPKSSNSTPTPSLSAKEMAKNRALERERDERRAANLIQGAYRFLGTFFSEQTSDSILLFGSVFCFTIFALVGNYLITDVLYWLYTWLLGNESIIAINWLLMGSAVLFASLSGGVRYFVGTVVLYLMIANLFFDNFFLFRIPDNFDQDISEEQTVQEESETTKPLPASSTQTSKSNSPNNKSSTQKESKSSSSQRPVQKKKSTSSQKSKSNGKKATQKKPASKKPTQKKKKPTQKKKPAQRKKKPTQNKKR